MISGAYRLARPFIDGHFFYRWRGDAERAAA